MFRIASFVVIANQKNQVLLCHRRDRDLWNLPGGGANFLELPKACAKREVKEEISFSIAIERLCGVYFKPKNLEIVFCYEGKINGGQFVISDEADQIEYFDPLALPSNIAPNHTQRIWDTMSKNFLIRFQ
ncbi:MAG: hypothetical protein OHK0017_03660 [Patescibacteria group bacterium]